MKLGAKCLRTGGKVLMLVVTAGLLAGATGCDTDVQTALVTGMNDAANAAASSLINAAFLSITPHEATDNTNGGTDTNGGSTDGGNQVPQV